MRIIRNMVVGLVVAMLGITTLGVGQASATEAVATTGTVRHWFDGDTVWLNGVGVVRLIGVDAADVEKCPNYKQRATDLSNAIAPVGSTVTVVRPAGMPTEDKYGRFLFYVMSAKGEDVGGSLIANNLADARYDSRDGYAWHPLEDAYRAADTPGNINDRGVARYCPLIPTKDDKREHRDEFRDNACHVWRVGKYMSKSQRKYVKYMRVSCHDRVLRKIRWDRALWEMGQGGRPSKHTSKAAPKRYYAPGGATYTPR